MVIGGLYRYTGHVLGERFNFCGGKLINEKDSSVHITLINKAFLTSCSQVDSPVFQIRLAG